MTMIAHRDTFFPIKGERSGGKWSEPKIILCSFFAILFPAAILLTLPPFSVAGLSFSDALFTATSAISVTGLGVVDTGTQFTVSGQILLMILMQIGGLGQMTLSALLLYMFGLRLSLRQQALTKQALGQDKSINLRRLVKHIIIFSLVAELIGFLLLCVSWVPELGWREGMFSAIFHAVSAFNNAGFSLYPDSLMSYATDPVINLTIASLIILGGIGFTVISDLRINAARGFSHLQLHTKIMLVATPCLILVGTVLFWLLEHNNPATLGQFQPGQQWLVAFFQSVTARTAGFNSVDIGAFTQAALLIMLILMLIGAGSTSTGGGIKVSTFVVAIVATWSFLRQRPHVTLFKRTVPARTVTKCLAIIMISGLNLSLAMFVLLLTEDASMEQVVFETISAFSTVGLTTGLTAKLSETGKYVLILVMIIGRIGPLTLAYLLARPKPTLLKYPEDNVFAG